MKNRLARSPKGAPALAARALALSGALALAALALAPSAALAASPATVSVRIEGATTTLLPRTTVTTTTTPVVKDSNPAHSCAGTGVAGALQQATGGNWGASWSDGLGYYVTSLMGAAPPDPSSYFVLWVNERSSQTGICGTELQSGDSVLFFLDRCDYDAQVGGCANQPVLPLGLSAPARAVRGKPFTVRVVRYAADGTPAPVAGATVGDDAASVVTKADGTASVTATGDAVALRAAKDGFARSDTATTTLCASLAADGSCLSGGGVVVAPPPARDLAAPVAQFSSLRHNEVFSAGRGPRLLRGTVGSDPSGIARVELKLTGRDRGRCSRYDAAREQFLRAPCRRNPARAFAVGDRASWSYLLPRRLPRGRWLVTLTAADRAGNRSAPVDRVTRIAVYVGTRRPR